MAGLAYHAHVSTSMNTIAILMPTTPINFVVSFAACYFEFVVIGKRCINDTNDCPFAIRMIGHFTTADGLGEMGFGQRH